VATAAASRVGNRVATSAVGRGVSAASRGISSAVRKGTSAVTRGASAVTRRAGAAVQRRAPGLASRTQNAAAAVRRGGRALRNDIDDRLRPPPGLPRSVAVRRARLGAKERRALDDEFAAGAKKHTREQPHQPAKVGKDDHEVSVHNDGEVWICSDVCQTARNKINEMLKHVDDPKLRARLIKLRNQTDDLQERSVGRTLDDAQQRAEADRIAAHLDDIGKRHPQVGGMLEDGKPRPTKEPTTPETKQPPANTVEAKTTKIDPDELPDKIARPQPGAAGSVEHRARRWQEYLARCDAEKRTPWTQTHWDNVYDDNMVKALRADKAARAYQVEMGYSRGQYEFKFPGDTKVHRRYDMAEPDDLMAVEHKTGYTYRSPEVMEELRRDKITRELGGWDIRWRFDEPPSEPLQRELREAGIPFTIKGVDP
jgi:hypothetical protein